MVVKALRLGCVACTLHWAEALAQLRRGTRCCVSASFGCVSASYEGLNIR